jgi:phosphomevalonate kinase
MRFLVPLAVMSALSLTCVYAPASSIDNSPMALTELQAKVDHAQTRDRCFLYAELVSQMTDLASQQLNSGDSGQASETLKLVQRYAEKIHMGIPDDSKKLRDAELLIRRTALRVKGMLNKASYEDQPALDLTLKQLNQIQKELMMQVFKK